MGQQEAKVLFAMNLADYMRERHVTRRELSDATGIPYTTISNWLQATRFPRPEQLDKIATYLNVSCADLLDDGVEAYEQAQRLVSRKELQFALWGDEEGMDDEDLQAVLDYAEYVKARKAAKNKANQE